MTETPAPESMPNPPTEGTATNRRIRLLLLGVGLVVGMAAVAAALSRSGGDPSVSGAALPLSDATPTELAVAPPPTPPSTTISTGPPPTSLPAGGSLVATVRPEPVGVAEAGVAEAGLAEAGGGGEVLVWSEPGGVEPEWRLSALTEFGSERHFLVLDHESDEDWLQVAVPVRPNGTVGWIPRSDAALSVTEFRVRVALSDRSLQIWRGDELVLDTTSAVGNSRAPTPLGHYYIRDIFAWDPESVYGPWVLALSAYSEHIDQINGGEAVVAIHGTNRPDLIGQAVSLGCIRLRNEDVIRLAQTVPVGTPIEIVA